MPTSFTAAAQLSSRGTLQPLILTAYRCRPSEQAIQLISLAPPVSNDINNNNINGNDSNNNDNSNSNNNNNDNNNNNYNDSTKLVIIPFIQDLSIDVEYLLLTRLRYEVSLILCLF